jgi:hypothetical protein
MRMDVRDLLDDEGKLSLDSLVNAKIRTPGHPNTAWDDATTAFVKDGDKNALLQVYLTTPP